MEDDIVVRRLVDVLIGFSNSTSSVEEDLAYSITKEFLQNIKQVLLIKQIFIDKRWKIFLNEFPNKMLSSLELFLRHVIYACRQEASVNLKIFERFLSVLSLLIYIKEETFKRTEVNFGELIPHIFWLLYLKDIKETFLRRGGFHRFLDYINNSKYLQILMDCHISSFNSNANIPEGLRKKMEKMLREENELPANFKLEDAMKCHSSGFLAKKILQYTETELPSLPSLARLKAKLYEQKMAQLAEEQKVLETEVKVLEECLRLDSDSDANGVVRQMANETWCERIIEAVIKCNHSKNSDHVSKKNRIQEEAEDILKHLTDKITTLIEVLDEYENE